jgi:DNA-binding phage protein
MNGDLMKPQNFGMNLSAHLKSEGRLVTWLSEKTGIGYDRLHRISTGSEPTFDETIAICAVLGKKITDLAN